MKRAAITIRATPFEALVCIVSLPIGGAVAAGKVHPLALEIEVTSLGMRLWGALVVIASATTLVGILWRGRRAVTGLVIEQVGLTAMGGLLVVHATASAVALGDAAAFSTGLTAATAFACSLRVWTITSALRSIVRGQTEAPP